MNAPLLAHPLSGRVQNAVPNTGNRANFYTVFFEFAPRRDGTDLEPITNVAIATRLQKVLFA